MGDVLIAPPQGGPAMTSNTERSNDFVNNGVDAAVELFGGVADAFGSAVRKAGDEVDKDNVGRFGLKNGLLRGMVEGTAHFLDKLPDVIRNTYDVLTSSDDEKKPAKARKPR
jgi:hypothetical protein